MRFSRYGTAALAVFVFLLAGVLCACAGEKRPAINPMPEATAEPQTPPDPVEPTSVLLGERTYTPRDESIYAVGVSYDALCQAADILKNVRYITLGETEFDREQLNDLSLIYPDAEIRWSVKILDKTYPCQTESLDLHEITAEEVEAVCRKLPLLPELKTISLLPEEGPTGLEISDIDRIAAAVPDVRIHCRFLLYGQLADQDTDELRYKKKKIGDDGITVFRQALPYLYSLKLLRLYECGIEDHDAMAALRSDFPDVNVVWSITIAGSPFMTDTTLIHTPLLRDKHVHLLQYFPDVQFFDIGHNHYLTNIEFLKYLPKLTVCIMAITKITDISPLANCPDLEFLELFTTPVEDISVLSSLTKLEYLNIGTMKNLRDISPIFGLKNLKMVRICGSSFDHVSREQVEQLKEMLPDCFVSDGPGDPTTAGGWRYDENHNYTPRYALLRKQMLYDKANWKDRQSNSPSA